MFKIKNLFSSFWVSFLLGMLLLFLINFIPIKGDIFTSIDEVMTSICGDGYAVAASTITPTGITYPNPNYCYYDNDLSTSPATIVSTDTWSGPVGLYLKKLIVSNSSTVDAYIILTSSETDSASTEIASFLVPKANGVNQPGRFHLDWTSVNISSDTKFKIEASTTPGSGSIRCSLGFEKY